MSLVAQRLMTAEEFWQSANSKRRELVRGEVVETPISGALHAAIVTTLGSLLSTWSQRSGGGYVAARAGYILARNPDTVRGPDLSYVRAESIPPEGVPEGFWLFAPDLAVEVYFARRQGI